MKSVNEDGPAKAYIRANPHLEKVVPLMREIARKHWELHGESFADDVRPLAENLAARRTE